jgi:hypothetical protein
MTEHDAGLRAAAPDLLAALRKIVTELEGNDSHHHYRLSPEQLAVARAAIAKAEGRVAP